MQAVKIKKNTPVDYEVQCRICLENASVGMQDHIFTTDTGDVMVTDAYNYFSSIKDQIGDKMFPEFLCELCTSQLIDSYRFLIRLQWSDEKFLSELTARTSEEELIVSDVMVPQQSTETIRPPNEETSGTNMNALKIVVTSETILPTEAVPKIIRKAEPNAAAAKIATNQPSSSSNNKPSSTTNKISALASNKSAATASNKTAATASIYLTNKVATLLKNAGIAKQSTVAGTKRKHPQAKTTANIPLKQPKVRCDVDMSNIALPQFVISSQTFAPQNEPTADGSIPVEHNSEDDVEPKDSTATAVKTLDVNMVRLTGADAQNLDFDSIQPTHHVNDNDTSMYVCKYCPKAFSTSYHLILHSRKSHVCQFCLQGFPKVAELHRHVKETHNEFVCPFCERVFVCNSNLRAHIRRTHNVRLPANVSLMTLDNKGTHEDVNKKDSV